MAWNYGNKRWTVPFVSLNGTSCRVDIYQRGYTGSSVITLTGADNPFEYAEGDKNDLLNDVIRYRTGYLRVKEDNYGDLDALYPQLNTDHFIEFYYGTTLDFTGFIQAQEFDKEWGPGPRVIEMPVISPLGLASGTYFDYTNFNPPCWVSFFGLLSRIFNALDASYTGYYFPRILSPQSIGNVLADFYVNSLTFCPFGTEYDKTNTMNGIYNPRNIGDALTMFCTTFGVIIHDQPERPIFQRVDYEGDYINYGLSSGRTAVTPGTTDITAIASVSSAENVESVVMPLSKIQVTYAGDGNVPDMSFGRCRGYGRGCAVPDRQFCTNLPMIDDLQGNFVNDEGIDNNGMLTLYGSICLGAYGGGSLSEMIIYRPESTSWANRTLIAKYTFFEWYEMHQRLHFRFQFGSGLEDLTNPTPSFNSTVGIVIRCGNYYWSAQSNSWLEIPAGFSGYSKTWNGNDYDTCEISFSSSGPGHGAPNPLTVEFYAASGHTGAYIYCIHDVKLEQFDSAANAYLHRNLYKQTFTINGSPSDIEGSVERGYGMSAPTINRIRYNGSHITGTDEAAMVDNAPTYPYLLQAQDRLQVAMKMTYQTAATLYLNKMTVWGSTGKWRVIARTFRPWNDEHVLTFHHSPVFDDNN